MNDIFEQGLDKYLPKQDLRKLPTERSPILNFLPISIASLRWNLLGNSSKNFFLFSL